MTVNLSTLSVELLTCIAEFLTSKDLTALSRCNKAMYQLQYIDSLWKYHCNVEFGINYNHPDRTFRELFIACCSTQSEKGYQKRLPCNHIDYGMAVTPELIDALNQCQRCSSEGYDNLFICVSPQCYQTLCDRHSRQHAKSNGHPYHSIVYKMNTSELFCQVCVDWIGGVDSDPAEQYTASQIIKGIVQHLEPPVDATAVKSRAIRQIERRLRWQDTPQYIMKHGFCFINARWMAEWEMFIEGWRTLPPSAIDQRRLLASVTSLNRVGTNPFYLNSNDNVMIISNKTWEYLSRQYKVKGNKLTEQDLKPTVKYASIINRIEYWKRRAADFSR